MTKIFGVDFAPLHIPLQRRLETLGAINFTFSFLFLGFFCLFFMISLLFTQFYYIPLLYSVWYFWDRKTSARGGRPIQWVREWRIWKYLQAYFPMNLIKTEDLDPKKNYIVGYHPHGILSTGAFCHFCTEGSGFSKKFPGIKPHLSVLPGHFQFPLYREYFMCAGAVEVTRDSLEYLMTRHGTGNAVVIVVGGALEALEAFPGRYNLKLKNKKGFIKLALRTGASLVPVFSFGEIDLYTQIENPEGSKLRKLQNFLTKFTGFSPPIFHGRGVFQYTYGLLPYRKPVYTVVGAPIDVEKCEKPTQEQIDDLHTKYVSALENIFETNKAKYGVPEDKVLHIVD